MRETKGVLFSWAKSLSLLALFFIVTLPALSQYSSGIEGTVTDQSGAVIPSAQVTITNQDTQVKQIAVSNTQGFVQILHLAPGRYHATVVATGFSTWEQKDIDIEDSDVRTMYPKLSVGAIQSTVEVTANSSAVETTSGTISRVLEQQTVESAPLVGKTSTPASPRSRPESPASEAPSVVQAVQGRRAPIASMPNRAFRSSEPVSVRKQTNIRSMEPV